MRITLNTIDKVYRAGRATAETMELKGYEEIANLFVDSSGFGQDSEPALTGSQFESELTALLKEHGQLTAKITGSGMFQVYVGLFKKTGKSRAKEVANNTYRIDYGDYEAIRLHDTNILEFHEKYIVLNSGGWQTRTTKERMSQYLPDGLSISQKNFQWYIYNHKDNSYLPYSDGMKLYL